METFYRFVEETLWEDSGMIIRLLEFKVLRRTPKGTWIERNPLGQWQGAKPKPRFILDGEGKRFAFPSITQAKASFIRRKESHIWRLEQALIFAKAALKGAQDPAFTPNAEFQDETLSPFHSY